MSFRKITEMTAYGAFGLARKNPKKGEPYSLKNIAKYAIDASKYDTKGATPKREIKEETKKKKKTNDLKIAGSTSKKSKSKSNKGTDFSGSGDANL
jgi:hypothetical protein